MSTDTPTSAYSSAGDHVEPQEGYTQRGFGRYLTLVDLDQQDLQVVESSAATSQAVRIYIKNPKHAHRDEASGMDIYPCAHLTLGQAVRLRDALNNFILHATNPN